MINNKFKQTEIGLIPEEWEVINGNECMELIIGSRPKGGIKEGGEIPSLGGEHVDLATNRVDFHKSPKYISRDFFSSMKRGKVKKNDILINKDGAYTGKIAFIWDLFDEDIAINEHLFIIRSKKINQKYLFYYLISNFGQFQIQKNITGSAQPGLNTQFIKKIKIPSPSIVEQVKIAEFLSNLDEKINILQKQNETLEKIGRAIFNHWFVDFEFPNDEGTSYKSSGSLMVESELGEIPKGWKVGKLGDFIESISGCPYTSKGLEESENALVTLKSISVNGFSQEGFKEYTGDYKDKHVVEDGDIVVAHTDLTQNRIILGKPAVVRGLGKYKIMIASMDLSIVRPNELLNRPYLFYLLSTNKFHSHAQGYANGTTVIHLSRKAVPEYKFVVPSEDIMNQFKIISNFLFDRIDINQKQILNLQKTRDLLLPKFISGQIRVPFGVEE